MEKSAERFLQAEEAADRLVQSLHELHDEAVSYQTATQELGAARERLVKLIDSMEEIAHGSYEVVQQLKEIGSPEILDRIAQLDTESADEFARQSKTLRTLTGLVIMVLVSTVVAIVVSVLAP